MKYLTLFLLFFVSIIKAQLVPIIQFTEIESFIDIDFINELHGFVVSNTGTVYKSTNSGKSWEEINIPGNKGVQAVTSGSDGIVFVAGFNGMVKRTLDGGITWLDVSVAELPDAEFTFVKRVSSNSLVVAGKKGHFARSDDNGAHWRVSQIGKENINNVVFTDFLRGWALMDEGIVVKTTNGGITWSPFHVETAGKDVKGIIEYGNVMMVVGDQWLFTSSNDWGMTWTTPSATLIPHDLVETKQIEQNVFITMDTAGYLNSYILESGGIYGYTVYTVKRPQRRFFGFWTKENYLYAVTDGPNVYTSNDMGKNFSSPIVTFGGRPIFSLQVISKSDYIISGNTPVKDGKSYGYLARTTNGGETWKYTHEGDWVNKEYYLSNGEGFRVLERSEEHSSNSGVTWSPLTTIITGVIISSQSFSKELGYFIVTDTLTKPRNQSYSSIYKRTGSGKTLLKNYPGTRLTHLDFINSLNGWTLRDSTQFNITTNGGANWRFTPVVTPLISSYLRFGSSSGILTTRSGRIMKTMDNTETWSLLFKDTTLRFNSIAAIDSNHLIVVGDSGIIFTSANGGSSWTSLNTRMEVNFSHVKMIDSSEFIVTSTKGGIYKGSLNDPWFQAGGEANQVLPENQIIGNFPNPFNNSTVIEFFSSESKDVIVTVYDITGRQVLSDVINANHGNNRYSFNSGNLNSGVYFYVLDFGGKREYSKMILLK